MPIKLLATALIVASLFSIKLIPLKNEKPPAPDSTGVNKVIESVTKEEVIHAQEDYYEPIVLEIKNINLKAEIKSVGLNDENLMTVPPENNKVGWWKYGAKIGEPGNTVLAGHYKVEDGTPGVFFDLSELRIGDEITIGGKNDLENSYKIAQIELYSTEEFPTKEIYAQNTESANSVIMITCAGEYIKGNYTKRLVVRANKI